MLDLLLHDYGSSGIQSRYLHKQVSFHEARSMTNRCSSLWNTILFNENIFVALSGLVVSVLATGPKVCRFKPSQGQWIFNITKTLQHNILQRESKAICPMLYDFAAY
jgi:hypothetical protein